MAKQIKKELVKNLIVFIVTIILILLLAEILTRVFVEEKPVTDVWVYSGNFEQGFGLTPNFQGLFFGKEVFINSMGFRDKEYTINKLENTLRIAVVGDSITFGYGVVQNETYPKLLEQKLNDRSKNKINYEVMNFGVPGYNTVQEYEILKDKVMNYSPSIVIMGFFFNDAEEKNSPENKNIDSNLVENIFLLEKYLQKKSRFYTYIKFKLNARFFMETFSNKVTFPYFVGTFKDNSSAFNSFENALEGIGNLTKEEGIPVLFVMHPLLHHSTINMDYDSPLFEIHNKVRKLAEKQGFIVIELFDYVKDKKLYDLRLKSMYDYHPDVLYYDTAAEAIYKKLMEEKLIS